MYELSQKNTQGVTGGFAGTEVYELSQKNMQEAASGCFVRTTTAAVAAAILASLGTLLFVANQLAGALRRR